MADLLSILSFSGTSLGAQRGALQTASHNLSNAATPGYSRQRAELTAVLPGERYGASLLGRGAQLSAVSQARDRYVEAQMPAGLAANARSQAESEALSALSTLDPTSEQGLSAALGDFYSGLRGVAQNPGNLPLREAAAGKTRALALAFNRAATDLDAARDGADQRIDGLTAEVNARAAEVASLNAQIRTARAGGESPNDLLDARQKSLDRLAELAGGVPVLDAQGDVSVALPSGTALVSGDRAGSLSTLPDANNGGHFALQLTRPDGSGPFTLSSSPGGEIGGLLDARDGALKSAQTSIDTLAFDLASKVNAAHRAGYGLDGVSGRDLLDAGTTASGAASRIQLSAAVAADSRAIAAASSAATVPGDATNLQAVIATESQALSTGDTAAAGLARTTAQFGAAAQRAQVAFEADGAALDQLGALRQSASGVSIDEEMVNMTKAQRAFEAITKVMSTADEMLDTLMKLKG